MKKIMVFDVPAESGGALTILNQFYEKALLDKENDYIFVTGKISLTESENVKNISFPWIKKSWIHRLFFDEFLAHKLVKEQKIDEILSLQNVSIKKSDISQKLYIHQPLPFVDKRYKITENLKFWLYQNIISKRIYKSAQTVDEVIVQTEWFKKEVVKRANINSSKVVIQIPETNIKVEKYFERNEKNLKTFFYPASALSYKNHKVIIEAALLLKRQGVDDFEIIFTLEGDENKEISGLHDTAKFNKLPITFIGSIPYDDVLSYYSHSILLFPSHIETYGLPLLEAREHKTAILASGYPFSKEILKNYDDARFLNPNDPAEWAFYIQLLSNNISQMNQTVR